MPRTPPLSRRATLGIGAAAALSVMLPLPRPARAGVSDVHKFTLTPGRTRLPVLGAAHPATRLWAFNGALPGPVIRLPQGATLEAVVENRLPQPTTVHWHGVRLPHPMDGVPGLTQAPIAPGGRFTYRFAPPDAGTFWYHPHVSSSEQLGRGLWGALIVDEPAPPAVDRDLLWVLGDLRLDERAQITSDFNDHHDISHGGRTGNTLLLNGRLAERFDLRAGERIRLRLLNTANARIFALSFPGHAPWLIAQDGHPLAPRRLDGPLALGPGMRADLILDGSGAPGSVAPVLDHGFGLDPGRSGETLFDLAYTAEPPLRGPEALAALGPPLPLAANPLPEPMPSASDAVRVGIVLSGGMMGSMTGAKLHGRWSDSRALLRRGLAWAVNGEAVVMDGAKGHVHPPLATIPRGRTAVLTFRNDTRWPHPMHLHGFAFRILTRNGVHEAGQPWSDTVLLAPDETVEVAFVADNPGDWMMHCHILEHQQGGMMGTIKVA